MKDTEKTEERLIEELAELWQKVGEFKKIETERKLAEEMLQANTLRLQKALALTQIGNWSFDQVENRFVGSEDLCRILEVAPEQLKTPRDVIFSAIYAEDRDAIDRRYASAMRDRMPFAAIYRLFMADGRIKFVHQVFQTHYARDGAPLFYVGSAQDITSQVEENKAHRESEEKFRLSFENANIGVCLVSLESQFTKVNSQMCEIFGYSRDQLESMTINDITHPEDMHISPTIIQQSASGDIEHAHFEKRYYHKQGHVVWGFVSTSLVRDSQGTPSYFISHVQDITERKQAEDALRENEIKYHSLFEQANDSIFIIDPLTHRLLDVNGNAANYLGYTREELLGMSLGDIYAPVAQSHNEQLIHNLQQEGSIIFEHIQQHKDGTEIPVEVSSRIIEYEGQQIIQSIVRDITERKQAEQRLRQVESRMVGILDSAYDAIISVDEAQRIVLFNKAAERVFGYTVAEVMGQPLELLIPETLRLVHQKHMKKFEQLPEARLMGGQPISGQRKNGEIFPAESSISKLQINDEIIFTAILRDISDRIELEDQLRQSQKMEAVGQLTAGIAHNFNNRLMVISTAIESQLLIGAFDADQLKLAESSVEQAAQMVNQLMLFSRLEGGVESKPIQVQQVLSDVGEIGHKNFDRKIALIDRIPRDLPLVSGDNIQIEQIFLNLLLNARDAVEEGNVSSPSIQMEANVVSFEEEDLPADLASHQRNYIRIDVIDNGIGMAPETQQRVFEPFFTTKEVDKGTGLGLATAYAIVKDHQGWIECESQVGIGTTFSVYLPVAEPEMVSSDVEQPQTRPRGTETLLIIEDEEDLRDQLVSVFKQYGYEVLVGKDGQEGWQIFERQREHIDVVLLDLSLPNVSGQEILARMSTLNPDVKVILSTGYAQHSAETLGARALLKKPYRITQALHMIREVLDGAP